MARMSPRMVAIEVFGILAYGTTVGAGAWLADRNTPMYAAVGARFLIAGLCMFVLLRGMGRAAIPVPGERLQLAAIASGCYVVEAICFYQALRGGATLAVVGVLLAAPAGMAIYEQLETKTEWTRGVVLGVALVVSGLIVIGFAGGSGRISLKGFLWAAAAAVAFAVYSIAAPRLMDRTPAVTAAAWSSTWVGIGSCAIALLSRDVSTPPSSEIAVVVGSGIATAAAFLALFVVLDRFDSSDIAVAVLGQGTVAVLGVMAVGATIGFETTVGTIAVIIGSVVVAAKALSGSGSVDHPP